MILERSHLAGSVSAIGQHCSACHAVITPGPAFYKIGQRVGVIIATTSEALGHYAVFTETVETPAPCR